MRILSAHFSHDANCTLLEDGEPVVVLEKERLSRTKHDQGVMDLEGILEEYTLIFPLQAPAASQKAAALQSPFTRYSPILYV